MLETSSRRAVIIGVQLPTVSDDDFASSLEELRRLAKTLGLKVLATVTQKRPQLSKASVFGPGKLKELAHLTGGTGTVPSGAKRKTKKAIYKVGEGRVDDEDDDEAEDADEDTDGDDQDEDAPAPGPGRALSEEERAGVVLVDHDISPSQASNLEKATDAEVVDRTAIILAIFQRHARTREAKLEVEIARLAYMAPRLRESGGGADRQRGGGVVSRGGGETSLEMDRRKVRDRIAELKIELADVERTSRTRAERRQAMSTAALVGYTNAGKSSLMRALTGSEVLVEDKLFATLDTTVRALQPETKPRILISDTVGFIKKLPHGLVASFRATLETARDTDLLLHVVDAADPAFESQIEVTRQALREINADAPTILLLNKIDRLPPMEANRLHEEHPDAVLMSALLPEDVTALRERIIAFFERDMVEEEIFVSYDRTAMVNELHQRVRVLSEVYEDNGVRLRVRAHPDSLSRFRQ